MDNQLKLLMARRRGRQNPRSALRTVAWGVEARTVTAGIATVLTRLAVIVVLGAVVAPARGDSVPTPEEAAEASAERGYRWLLERPFVPADFDQETFDAVWRVWPEPLRRAAEEADPATRRRMAFERYGLTPRPGDESGKPLQFVVDAVGGWHPNCFTCHGGLVRNDVVPGAPNTLYAIQTMHEEVARSRYELGKSVVPLDVKSALIPLGGTRGTTNAVIFGLALGAQRNPDLTMKRFVLPRRWLHHDMDAPPWWHTSLRSRLYLTGFAAKDHRALMQFALNRTNDSDWFSRNESYFEDVLAYIESIEPPRFPFPVNAELAERGRDVFEQNCAECHGTYGPGGDVDYPLEMVAMERIGTDRARWEAASRDDRLAYQRGWFSYFGEQQVIEEPAGYVAPPLTGVWASAPYLHNGSVPTLWHLLRPTERPEVWRRVDPRDYDSERVGLPFVAGEAALDLGPGAEDDPAAQREVFDTREFGKSAAGHLFPAVLSEAEKQAVLEYLKTL